jgi:hypothetical protein
MGRAWRVWRVGCAFWGIWRFSGEKLMQTLNLKPTDKKVGEYYKALAEFRARDVSYELAVRSAFQSLLDA